MKKHVRLLDLPNELLRHIKALLGPNDLTANACFYMLCYRTAACFDDQARGDKFWEVLCRANGLSVTSKDALYPGPWREIALDCARHAWSCKIPECGMQRLQANRSLMELARTSWSLDWTYPDAIQHGPDDADHGLASNTIFEQLAFWTTPTNGGFEFRDTPYLRHADQSLAQEIRPGTKLRKHPIVYRSFAMFPPVAAAASDWVIDFEMENPYGITVQDVVDGLLTVMDQQITMRDFRLLLDMTDEPDGVFPASWPIFQRASSLEQFRDWLKIVKIKEIGFGKNHITWGTEFAFARRELPAKPEYIQGLSSEDIEY